MRILITGIPGTGKTTIGNYLQDTNGFFHMDMESDEDGGYQKITEMQSSLTKFVETYIPESDDVVMTWGFVPHEDNIKIINTLKNDFNFKLFWFDGDRAAARQAFIERSTKKGPKYLEMAMRELETQMQAINNSNFTKRISAIQINTFNINHQFRNLEEVATEMLSNYF